VAWAVSLCCSIDVAIAVITLVMLWRGWLPPFDDGDDDGGPDGDPQVGGPWTRAHTFRLPR
jgi:hypothetical protein